MVALALAACGDGNEAERPAVSDPVEDAVPAAEATKVTVPALDVPGSFEGVVSDLAIWQHPSLPFESGVVAANGEAGLFLITPEGGGRQLSTETFSASVDVAYTADEAGVVRSLIAAPVGAERQLRLFDLAADGTLTARRVDGAALPDQVRAACLFGGTDGPLGMISLVDGARQVQAVTLSLAGDDTVRAVPMTTIENEGWQACAGGPDATVWLKGADGVVHFIEFDEEPATVFETGLTGAPDDQPIDVFAVSAEAGFMVLALDAVDTATVLRGLHDQDRFEVYFDGFSDVGEVLVPSAFAVGTGNYGGIYRDGMIAIAEKQPSGRLVLVPLSALVRAVELDEVAELPVNRPDFGVQIGGDLDLISVNEN